MYLFGGEASGPDEVRIRAHENLEMGSDGLKIVGSGGTTIGTKPHEASYSVDELRAASEVAHANGKVITSHALPLEAMRRALEADIDGIEHLGFLSSATESTFDVDLARRMADKGMTFGSTLGVNKAYIGLAADGLTPDYELESQRYRSKYYIDNARQLHEVGGRLVAASDAGWKFTPFGRFSEELMLLGQAGLSPMHVIAAATSISADYLRLADVGRLAPGFSADFVVVNGDPIVDLGVVENIVSVGARGQVVPLGNAP
jgi:imidazolonepropionase-like amidohydrolase